MSKVIIAGDVNGSGVFTLAAPNGNTNRTLTLPDEAGTMALQGGAGVGKVLQVVNFTYNTNTSTTTATYVDTGLTATITPSSSNSKILVLVNQAGIRKMGNVYLGLKLFRDASEILQFAVTSGYTTTTTTNGVGSDSACYLDSPASTSAVVYKTQFNATSSATTWVQVSGAASTITLMEIAG